LENDEQNNLALKYQKNDIHQNIRHKKKNDYFINLFILRIILININIQYGVRNGEF